MSDPLPVPCLSPPQVAGEDINNINLQNLNTLVANTLSEVVRKEDTLSKNVSDRCANQICDNGDAIGSLKLQNVLGNVNTKDAVVDNSNFTEAVNVTEVENAAVEMSDLCKQNKELIESIVSKGKLNSNVEDICSSLDFQGSPVNINGDNVESTFEQANVKKILENAFNNEVLSLPASEIISVDLLKHKSKSINGLKENVCTKELQNQIAASSIMKGSNVENPTILDISNESAHNMHNGFDDIISHSTPSEYVRPINFISKNSNGVHPRLSDEEAMTPIQCGSKLSNFDTPCTSQQNRSECIPFSNNNAVTKNEEKVLDHEKSNDSSLMSKSNINTVINIEKNIDESEMSAIDKSLSGEHLSTFESTKDKKKQSVFQIDEKHSSTCENVLNCTIAGSHALDCSENVLPCSETAICKCIADKGGNTTCNLRDSLSNRNNNFPSEEIKLCKNNSLELEHSNTNERHDGENFCIVCEKDVQHLYYHAVESHSCFAFVPVTYMLSYQEHLKERSPNIPEDYLHSLLGGDMYICKTCGIFLKSIQSVRIHLNVHSKIYVAFYSSDNCSCCKKNSMIDTQYISSLLFHSTHECFLCHQLASCELSLYNHLMVVHFHNNFCQKCSQPVQLSFSTVLNHNTIHYSKSTEVEKVSQDYYNYSWNVLNNNLNSLDGKQHQLHLKSDSIKDRAFKFPIEIKLSHEVGSTNVYISPSTFMKKYVDPKFTWKRALHSVSNYAALSFDVYIQMMLSKKLMLVKKQKVTCKKPANYLASLQLKQICRASKRKSAITAISSDINHSTTTALDDTSNHSSDITIDRSEGNNVTESNSVEISGEWSNTHTFVCCSCGISVDCLTEIMDHKWLEHPRVWCAHTMLKGKDSVPEMFTQQYLPIISRPTIKEATLKILQSNSRRSNIKCTKCKINIPVQDFCSHAVECGDLDQLVIKKKTRKSAKFQSHKGQRMSSRYTSLQRNTYKNFEEDSKLSSADVTSKRLSDWNQVSSVKATKKNTASTKKQVLAEQKKKAVLPKFTKKQTVVDPKKRKFAMKLRRGIVKNAKTKAGNCLSGVRKLTTAKGKTKLASNKSIKKLAKTQDILTSNKPSKIPKVKKSVENSKEIKPSSGVKKTRSIVNACNVALEHFKEKIIPSKPVIKKSKANSKSGLEKHVPVYEDDLSDSEVKMSSSSKRREGLRTRQKKVKKTGYSLRKTSDQPESGIERINKKEVKTFQEGDSESDSSFKDNFHKIPNDISTGKLPKNKIKNLHNTSCPEESLKSIHIKVEIDSEIDSLMVGNIPKLSKDLAAVTSHKKRQIKKPRKIRCLKKSLKSNNSKVKTNNEVSSSIVDSVQELPKNINAEKSFRTSNINKSRRSSRTKELHITDNAKLDANKEIHSSIISSVQEFAKDISIGTLHDNITAESSILSRPEETSNINSVNQESDIEMETPLASIVQQLPEDASKRESLETSHITKKRRNSRAKDSLKANSFKLETDSEIKTPSTKVQQLPEDITTEKLCKVSNVKRTRRNSSAKESLKINSTILQTYNPPLDGNAQELSKHITTNAPFETSEIKSDKISRVKGFRRTRVAKKSRKKLLAKKSLKISCAEKSQEMNSADEPLNYNAKEESLKGTNKNVGLKVRPMRQSIKGICLSKRKNCTKKCVSVNSVLESSDIDSLTEPEKSNSTRNPRVNQSKISKDANLSNQEFDTKNTEKFGCEKRKKRNVVKNPKKRRNEIDQQTILKESIGFPRKKRKYNIEDETDIVVCSSPNESLVNCSPIVKNKHRKCKTSKESTFSKFLECFKRKSRLSKGKKFAAFKTEYKLVERKSKVKALKRDIVIADNSTEPTLLMKTDLLESFPSKPDTSEQLPNLKRKGKKSSIAISNVCDKLDLPVSDKTIKNVTTCAKKVVKRSISKCKPKCSSKKRNENMSELTNTDDGSTNEVSKVISPECETITSAGNKVNVDLDEHELFENVISATKLKIVSSKSAATLSSASSNCNINISRKPDPVSERKRKSHSKENRYSCKKRKLRSKDTISEMPLQSELLCNDCGLLFDSISSKDEHNLDCRNIAFEMSIMTDEKLFECPHCQLTFAMEGTQKKHTTSCRSGRARKITKINLKTVKTNLPEGVEGNVNIMPTDKCATNSLPPEILPRDLRDIAEKFKVYCLAHNSASQVCSLLYSCSLSTTELRTCLCESVSFDNSTIVQAKPDSSINKTNFSLLKTLLDQLDSSDFANVLYKVMLSIKANSYIKMKDYNQPLITNSEIPPLVIEASRSDLLKALSGIEEYLKEAEEHENLVQKEDMLRNMKLTFEADTRS